MILSTLFTAIFLLFLLSGAVFVLVVFPIWMLMECIKSRFLPHAVKALWIVSIILAWPFGSLAYASFASQKRFLARISNFIMIVMIISSLLFSAGIYYFRRTLLPHAVSRYQKADYAGISKEDQDLIKSDLLILQNEMQANSFFSAKSLVALELFELFQSIVMRSAVSPSDLKDWTYQVALRTSTQEGSLGAYMNSLRDKTVKNILKNS